MMWNQSGKRHTRHAPPFVGYVTSLIIDGWQTWAWTVSCCVDGAWSTWAVGYSQTAEMAMQTADRRMRGEG